MKSLPILCLTAALAATAAAQPPASSAAWADPTRPAGALAADAAASAPRAAARAASAPTPAAPRLQSVQIGADGSASALVDGRIVQAGDALGALRVAAIDADGLTLRDAKGRSERLNLLPAAIVKLARRDGGAPQPLAAATERLAGREGRHP